MHKPDNEKLIASNDRNGCVIELDNYISELCEWGERLDVLSDEQKFFYFNEELEREINNGGLHQYFFNSSGSFAHQTVESLSAIGAKKTVDILQLAINQFPNGEVPQDTNMRRELMSALWSDCVNQVWEDLDDRFYKYEDDLNSLNMAFVTSNRNAF